MSPDLAIFCGGVLSTSAAIAGLAFLKFGD